LVTKLFFEGLQTEVERIIETVADGDPTYWVDESEQMSGATSLNQQVVVDDILSAVNSAMARLAANCWLSVLAQGEG